MNMHSQKSNTVVIILLVIMVISGLGHYFYLQESQKSIEINSLKTPNISKRTVVKGSTEANYIPTLSLDPTTWETFSNDNANFSFKYPKQWGKPRNSGWRTGNGVVFDQSSMIIEVGRYPDSHSNDPDVYVSYKKYVAAEIKDLKSYKGISNLVEDPVEVSGMNGAKIYYFEDKKQILEVIFAVGEDEIGMIEYTSELSATTTQLFTAFVENFKI